MWEYRKCKLALTTPSQIDFNKSCRIENWWKKCLHRPKKSATKHYCLPNFTVGQACVLAGYQKLASKSESQWGGLLGVGHGLAQGHCSSTDVSHLQGWNHLSYKLPSSKAILLNFHSRVVTSSLGETGTGCDLNQDQLLLMVSTGLD